MTTTSPSWPAARIASAARRPASEAPTTTTGALVIGASALRRDGGHRTDADGFLDQLALGVVDLLLPDQDVVVAELEDVGCHERALSVALAQVHVNVDLHGLPLVCQRRRRRNTMWSRSLPTTTLP